MFTKSFGSVCRVLMIGAVVSGILAFATPSSVHAQGILCTITVGGGGDSETYRAYVNEGTPVWEFPSIQAREFIRSTTGPCAFTVYNHENFGGPYVTLGTELDDRIRAGIDGVENRDGGGGDTWKVRSIRVELVSDQSCALEIGGNGVRMWYFNGRHEAVPAMNRIGHFAGVGGHTICEAVLYNSTDFTNRSFPINSYVVGNNKALDPGFRTRSLTIDRVPNS